MSLKFTDGSEQIVFSGPITTITTTFSATNAEVHLKSRAQILVDLDYAPGDETDIEILLEMSPDVTMPITTPATGVDYYSFTSVSSTGVLTVQDFSLTASTGAQKVRVPIPLLHQERILRISVRRAGGSDGGAGSIGIKVIDDSHPVTSALTGVQP